MKDREKIDNLLKLYFTERLSAKYRMEKRRSERESSLQGKAYQIGGERRSTSTGSSRIESHYIRKEEAAQRASFLKIILEDLKDLLEVLAEDDYKLLKWTYSKNNDLTDEGIAIKLNVSVWTVRKRRTDILKDLYKFINLDYYIKNPSEDIADYFKRLIS